MQIHTHTLTLSLSLSSIWGYIPAAHPHRGDPQQAQPKHAPNHEPGYLQGIASRYGGGGSGGCSNGCGGSLGDGCYESDGGRGRESSFHCDDIGRADVV